ncbi:hypothetical protein RHGRI_018247 [Rhododendron griersonianum]|uniref:Uncharacterized protein n=1 Tax=Rhododendron griersonianum TaxID=479676 RepID=A0AAV6K0Q9_9ERIC|nr:hypothetical protein RHGRI_018247 [Rhododendron griersonianum]
MILVIIVPLISPPKPDNTSSGSTHIKGADGPTTDPDPTLIPARDLMMASSSLTSDSSATHDRASDSGSTELSGGYSDGDRAMTSSQNPNVTESPPPALGNSSSATLLSSFLVLMVAVTTVFAFIFTLIGLMLEGVHQAVATVCSYAGLIWVVIGFFFMLATFVPERFVWLVWGSGGVLVVVFFYSLAKRTCNTSAESTPSSSV